MRSLIRLLVLAPIVTLIVACGGGGSDEPDAPANTAAAEQAHVAYLAAINSNDIDKFQMTITDDIVYVAPNLPEIVGKAAVNAWVSDYFAAYRTVWVKESLEFVVESDLAYERYSYKSVDTPRADGPAAGTPVVTDTGTGINIYRRGTDGVWRVARDAWATSKPVAAN